MAELIAFAGVAALVIVTPGPDTALTVRNTLLGGRDAGMWTAAGVTTGLAIWALFTSVGIAAVLVASEPAFLAIRYLGAAYLIWLGLQALVAAARSLPAPDYAPQGDRNTERLGRRAAMRQGLVNDLANPKIAAFFPSLLPQFAADFGAMLALGLLFAAMTLAWLAVYVAVVTRAGAVLKRPAVRRTTEAIMGTVLVALGLRLATDSSR
jgi:threonine/homoserine/homoserine lactone efflux protein